MIGDDLPLLWNEKPIFLLKAGDDAFNGRCEVPQVHTVGTAPSRQQCCLINEIGKVGAGEARGQFGDLLGFDIAGQHRLFQVYIQDGDAILLVRAVNEHLAVEAARARTAPGREPPGDWWQR